MEAIKYPRLIIVGDAGAYWAVGPGVFVWTEGAGVRPTAKVGWASLSALMKIKGEAEERCSAGLTLNASAEELEEMAIAGFTGRVTGRNTLYKEA